MTAGWQVRDFSGRHQGTLNSVQCLTVVKPVKFHFDSVGGATTGATIDRVRLTIVARSPALQSYCPSVWWRQRQRLPRRPLPWRPLPSIDGCHDDDNFASFCGGGRQLVTARVQHIQTTCSNNWQSDAVQMCNVRWRVMSGASLGHVSGGVATTHDCVRLATIMSRRITNN